MSLNQISQIKCFFNEQLSERNCEQFWSLGEVKVVAISESETVKDVSYRLVIGLKLVSYRAGKPMFFRKKFLGFLGF